MRIRPGGSGFSTHFLMLSSWSLVCMFAVVPFFEPFPRATPLRDAKLYYYGREYFSARYGETFTETDLWDLNIPTLEEYGEWTSVQAHAFLLRLLAPAGTATHSNYLRAFAIDPDILRAVGVR